MLNWSLMSLVDLIAFLFIQYTVPRKGEMLALILDVWHTSFLPFVYNLKIWCPIRNLVIRICSKIMIMFVSSHYLVVILLYFRCKYNYYLFFMTFFSPPNRISLASTIFHNVVCSHIILFDAALTCHISYCFGHRGGSVEYFRCSVGSANWIYKVLFWF